MTGRHAMAIAAVLACGAGAARADCIAYVVDICQLGGEVSDGFWVGEYEVSAGPGTFASSAGTYGIPPAGMQNATVFQMGDDLVIVHPERTLNADLVGVDGSEPEWTSEVSGEGASFEDVVLAAAGCNNSRLPRWTAPTQSDDGVPMTLSLVGVQPTMIVGRLSATGVHNGTPFSYERNILLTRDDFPHEELAETVLSHDECTAQCGQGTFVCPDFP